MSNIDWSGSYNGFAFGPGQIAHITEADGLDTLPAIRHNVTMRSYQDGAYFDASFLSTRVVTLNLVIADLDPAVVENTIISFVEAFQPQQAELPLTFRAGARVINCVPTSGPDATRTLDSLDRAIVAAKVELTATDPRIYGPLVTSSTSLLDPEGGLTFPLKFPLVFSNGAVTSGQVYIDNSGGSYATGVVFTVQGPATNPFLTQMNTGEQISINYDLSATDTVVIDTRQRTVLLNGGPRRDLVSFDSTFFMIPKRTVAPIRFQADAYTGGSTLTAVYSPAYLTIGG